MRAVAKEADERGMFALKDLHDAAFGAPVETASLDARECTIAVHGVAEAVAADEEVAFDARNRTVGDEEAVAVAMGNDAAGEEGRIASKLRLRAGARGR